MIPALTPSERSAFVNTQSWIRFSLVSRYLVALLIGVAFVLSSEERMGFAVFVGASRVVFSDIPDVCLELC